MSVVYLVVGVALLVLTVVDILWTTLWVDGGSGPLSSRLTSWLWRGLRRLGSNRSRTLSLAGPLILTLTLVVWVAGIWGGWTLVFASGENALVNARDASGVSWTGRIYFVAYAMFTMGNGDFYPGYGAWQIAAALTTASGMLFVTMGVSYVLSVLGAVSEKRSFASSTTGLGERSETVVGTGWDDGFRGLHLPLNSLASELDTLATQHKAYPILHYYHSEEATQSSAMAVAIFDEALTVLRFGVPGRDQPNTALVENARSATENYLETLDEAFIDPSEDAPTPPDLDRVREANVPTVSDDEFATAVGDLDERRRHLLGLVHSDAWQWPPRRR
ncbi:potassium channel family protein [Halobacterium wangiae]|uniref:potassium channel family protein n=1 Tax=Halobacterium wangiae TaxID=2902623 RepID=UPI001E51B7FD|nr:potassium channel family protein [Halobacterium wangiae]